MKIGILKLERTEEEKARRHLYGDKGASYKKGKQFWIDTGGISGTVTTLVTKDINLIYKDMAKVFRIRKLTPRSCFRLMGVSDGDIDKIQAAKISDTQCYKLAGNSIVVPVLEGIFTQLFRADEGVLF